MNLMKTTHSHIDTVPQETAENNTLKNVIEINHLKKSFGVKQVLDDVNLSLANQENLVILGKSGTGKSVLIKCIIGLIEPDEGSLVVLGKNIDGLKSKELNELRKQVGFLFQSAALYDSMTVRENLEFPFRNNKILKESEINAFVIEALEDVGLIDSIDKMPNELSGGMRKRIGLARSLILKPAIMLYDEPTTGLDPITSREISNLILKVQKKHKTASIIITHDIACAKIVADRILILHEVKCAVEGTFENLSNSNETWIKSYFE
jgi:phospholipid/cholesterol/gamma-HCH transport system ATP-binding protein